MKRRMVTTHASEVACVQELENAQDLALAVQGLKCACMYVVHACTSYN